MLARLMTMTLIAGLALPPVAKAEGLITSISPRQLAKILELEGEEMALSTINDDTTLHSSSAQRGDPKAPLPFEIFFYECDGGNSPPRPCRIVIASALSFAPMPPARPMPVKMPKSPIAGMRAFIWARSGGIRWVMSRSR